MGKYTISELWAMREAKKKENAQSEDNSSGTKSNKYTVSELWAQREEKKRKQASTSYESAVGYLEGRGDTSASGIMTEHEWKMRHAKNGGTYNDYLLEATTDESALDRLSGLKTINDDISSLQTNLSSAYTDWQDEDTMASLTQNAKDLRDRLGRYEAYRVKNLGDRYADASGYIESLNGIIPELDSLTDYYKQYGSREQYDRAKKAEQEMAEAYENFEPDKVLREIEERRKNLDKRYKELQEIIIVEGEGRDKDSPGQVALREQYDIQQELDDLDRQEQLCKEIKRSGNVVHKDDFWGQGKANYRLGDLSIKAGKARSRSLDYDSAIAKETASVYAALEQRYAKNNAAALDDEGQVYPWLSKNVAGYIPQFKDQLGPQIVGSAIGAGIGYVLRNPKAGASIGSSIAVGYNQYDIMRGSVYNELIQAGYDHKTALEAASDEALISGLIEGGGEAIGWVTAGGGKALDAIFGAAQKSVAKGTAGAATKLIVSVGAKKAAKGVSKPLLKKGFEFGVRTALNSASEYGEEFFQQGVSIANKDRLKSGETGAWNLAGKSFGTITDAVTGKNPEALSEMREAGNAGAITGGFLGGTRTITNAAVVRIFNAKTIAEQNMIIDTIINDEESLTALIDEGKASGKGSESAKIAAEVEKAKAKGKVTREQVKRLIAANEVYIQNEEKMAQLSAESSFDDAPTTLEEAARGFVESKGGASLDVSERAIFDDAEKKLIELGETENAIELSKIISKAATGQTLSSAETEAIANNENARKVFAQMDKSSNIELMEASEALTDGTPELFLETYEGGDIEQYKSDFQDVAYLAKKNYDVDFILEHKGALTPRQVQNIYSKVVAEPRAEQQRKLDELVKNHEGQLVRKANIDDSIFNGAKGQKLWRNLNSRQKKAITFVKAFAKGAGINLKITYDGKYNGKAYNGYYDHDTNTIVIDARAGFDRRYISEDAIIPTMSHELTHWMKQKSPELYAKLSKQIFDVFKAKGLTEYDLIATEKQKHPDMSDDAARDEIIARASEDLFKMSEEGKKIFESLSESEQKTLVGKIKELIQNLVDWANELLGLYESKSDEAGWLREFKDELSEISKTWDQMLAKAVEVNAALEGEGVLGNLENGISKDGTTIVGEGVLQMSEKTYYDGGRDYLAKWLKRQKGLTQKDKDDILRQTDKVAEIMRAVAEGNELPDYSRWANLEVVKDEKGEKVLSVIVKNGDYTMNIDFSQVCKKRVALNAVLNAMVQAGDLNVHVLTETDVADLNAIIKKHDFEIACALCFVDSKRYRVGAWAESFCEGTDTDDGTHKYGFNEMVRSLVPKGSKINVDEFNFTKRDIKNQPTKNLLSEASDSELDFSLIDKIMSENDVRSAQHRYARAIKENPQIRKILNSAEIISSIGLDAIRLEAPALYNIINGHQGTAKPKFSHDAVAYGNDVLKARGFTAKRAKMVGGVRCQSFSDFQANMIMDYAQFISELAAKKLTSHAYTKEPLFVKLFGMTGMKINMSLVPKAVDMTAEQQKQFAILKDKNADKNSEEYKAALEEYEKLAENAGLDENGNYIWEDETFPYDIAMEIVDDPRYSANCGTIAVGISKAHILKLLADDKISMVIPYHKSGLNRDVAMMRDIALYHDYTSVQNTRYANDEAMYGDDAGKKLNKDKGDRDFDFYGDLYGVGKKEGTHDPKKTAQNYLDWCDKHNYTPRFDEFRDHPNYYKLLVDFRVYDTDGTYREQQAVKAIYPEEAEFKDLILNGVKDKNGKVYGGLLQSQENSDRLKAETKQIVDEYRQTLREKYGQDVLGVQFSPKDVGYENKVFDFGITQSEIDSYVKKSYQKENDKSYIKFLEASDQLIEDVSSDIDISGYAHALRDNDIRHIRNSHGEMTNEKYPVTQSDIQMIPFVVENYDKVFYKTNANNQPGLLYVKVMPKNVIYYVEAITQEYGKEKLLINKQMIKTGINEIPNLAGVIDAINKKMSSSQYLADLEKIRKAYVQDVKENYSNSSISNSSEKSNEEIVNNDGVQMSEKDTGTSVYDIIGERKALEKRYNKLAADFANYKERVKLDKTLTKGKVIDPKQLEAVARYLVKFADSDYKTSELAKMLNDLYVDIQDGAMDDSMSWDEMYAKAYEVAKEIRSEAKIKIERPALYDKILKDIRSARIAPNEGQKGDAKHRFGEHYVGKFRGRVTIANDGTPLDIKWSEWAAEYPSVFDASIGDAQQLVELYDIYDDLRNAGNVVQEYEESEVLQSLATEIINKAWTVTKFESTADKQNKRIQELNAEHRKAMEELKNTYAKKVSDAKLLEQMYYGKLLNQVQTKRKQEVSEAKAAGRERLAQYKENAERNGIIKSITNYAKTLLDWYETNSKDKHIHDSLKEPVKDLLLAIDFSSKQLLGMDGTAKDKRNTPTKDDVAIFEALDKLKNSIDNFEGTDNIIDEMRESELPKRISDLLDTYKENQAAIQSERFVLNMMTSEELKKLRDIIKNVKSVVINANKFHIAHRNANAIQKAEESISQLDARAKTFEDNKKHFGQNMDMLKSKVYWNNLNPYYAFRNMGEAAQGIFEAFMDGDDKFIALSDNVETFAKGAWSDKESKAWRDTYFDFAITKPDGKVAKISMNIPQIMSLYCVTKQEDAKKHILHGQENYGGKGITLTSTKKTNAVTDNIPLTEAQLKEIIGVLDDKSKVGRAKEVADAIQEYMGRVGSQLGNEITMARWGIKSFGMVNYFPIRVSRDTINDGGEAPKTARTKLIALLNASFTHARNNYAQNSAEIGDIFDVFSTHMSDMILYNSYALPLLDMYKWMNYKSVDGTANENSVQRAVTKTFGEAGWDYLQKFLEDVGGTTKNDSRDNIGMKLFRKAKIAKVAAKLKVVVLQFTSFIRAGAVIDNKYLLHALHHVPKIKKAQENCGIARRKAKGYYDTDIARSLSENIKHEKSWYDKVIEVSLWGAGAADNVTMGVLWNACELEIRDTRKDLKVGSPEFNEAVALRLREVIYRTQVVDSLLTRSSNMRSKAGLVKMYTSFSSEPTLSLNLALDTIVTTQLDARELGSFKASLKKNGKYVRKAAIAYIVTAAATALLEAAFTYLYDYDDEEREEHFGWAALNNFIMNLSLTNKIPFVKEVWNFFQGYSSSNLSAGGIEEVVKLGKEVFKLLQGDASMDRIIKLGLQSSSDITGIPAYNLIRDFKMIYYNLFGYDE